MLSLARIRSLFGNRLVKNAAALFIVQMSAYAAPLIVLPYLSRVLSVEHFGLIAFATNFNFYFITLVEYGFNLSATRRIAIHRDNPQKISRIVASVYAAKFLLTVLGFVIMTGVVLATPKLRPHFTLFCLGYMAVIGDLLFPLWLFQGLEKMENLVWRDLCSKFLSLGLTFAFVHKDSDYMWAAAFQAGSIALAGVVGLCTVPFVISIRLVVPSLQETFSALKEGWPVFLSMAAFTLSSSTSIFLLGLRAGPRDVAYYIAAYRLVVALRVLVDPVKTAIYPHISHMASKSKRDAIQFLQRYGFLLTSPFLLASLVLFVFAPLIVRLLYGEKYAPAIPVMRLLAFSPFLLALQHNYSTFFMLAFGYEKQWSRIILFMTALNFALLIPLIYSIWPPVAVAWTGLICDVVVTVITYQFYRKNSTEAVPALAA
jgi:polysaccharide transporter, PST family